MARSFSHLPPKSQHESPLASKDLGGFPLDRRASWGCDVRVFVGSRCFLRTLSQARGGGEPAMSPRLKTPFGADAPISRRGLLKGMGATAGAVALPAALAACGGDDDSSSSSSSGGGSGGSTNPGTVTIGSNASDAVPKAAYVKVFDGFNKKTGGTVKVNTVDH